MQDAEWLFFFYMPVTYFFTLRTLFIPEAYPLVLLPFTGIVCLSLGVIEGIRKRHAKLFWFLMSPLLTQVATTILVLHREQVITFAASMILSILLVAQFVLLSFMTYRFAGMRRPAALLSVFGISFAMVSAFMAGMLFAETWP